MGGLFNRKFQQTTWNRLQGGWAGGSSKKRKSSSGSGAAATVEGTTVGGETPGSVADAFDAGALSEARETRRRGGLVLEGPDTFTGGYGTIGG